MQNSGKYLDCDLHSASPEYAARFSGVVGEWLLKIQSDIVEKFLDKKNNRYSSNINALDVGGGHAQIIPSLLKSRLQTTLLSSSEDASCAARDLIDNNKIDLKIGNLLEIPFADKSFDVVSCFRIVSHCEDWKVLIAELCRVSRGSVIIDYPTYKSLNILSFLLFPIKKKIEGNTRTFITFWDSDIENEFKKNSFNLVLKEGQFVLPMGIHRALKNPKVSKAIEKILFILGFKYFSSPLIVNFERTIA